jgi:hypothetical protein
MVFTISYFATGSESVRQRMVVRVRRVGWADFGAHRREQPPLGGDVAHLGNVFENDLVLGQNRRRHAGQRRVLGPRDANRACERIAAANDKFIHECRRTSGFLV